jgi:hypothetical protein
MTNVDGKQETRRGRAIYEMLLSVHSAIRRDLERVERLAERSLEGLPAEQISEELNEIKRDGMLWHLQIDCLRYCRFVHMHHNVEDRDFFPELRQVNPDLDPVIDRLEGDHRRVSDQLDAVETAARALAKDEGVTARRAVVDALHDLAENLLEHLDYEELSLEATVRRIPDAGVGFS